MKKTLFEEPTEKPCNTSSQSNVSSSEAGVSYKASCSGAVDQYSNLLLKNENKRLEKDNKKLVAKLTQLEAELKRYKENRKKRSVNQVNYMLTLYCMMNFPLLCESLTCKSWFYPLWNLFFFFFISEEKEKISEGKEKMSSVVKKEPLEGTIFFFERNHNSFHHCICLSFLIEVKIFFSSNCIFSPQIPSWHSLTFPYPKHQLVFKCRVGLGRSSRHLKGKSCPQMILIPKTSVPPNKWTVILWELCLLPFNL